MKRVELLSQSNESEKQMQTDPPMSDITCCTSPVNLSLKLMDLMCPRRLLKVGRKEELRDTPVWDHIASAIKTKPKKKQPTVNRQVKKFFNERDAHID